MEQSPNMQNELDEKSQAAFEEQYPGINFESDMKPYPEQSYPGGEVTPPTSDEQAKWDEFPGNNHEAKSTKINIDYQTSGEEDVIVKAPRATDVVEGKPYINADIAGELASKVIGEVEGSPGDSIDLPAPVEAAEKDTRELESV